MILCLEMSSAVRNLYRSLSFKYSNAAPVFQGFLPVGYPTLIEKQPLLYLQFPFNSVFGFVHSMPLLTDWLSVITENIQLHYGKYQYLCTE